MKIIVENGNYYDKPVLDIIDFVRLSCNSKMNIVVNGLKFSPNICKLIF